VYSECLRGDRHLSHLLDATGLRSERCGSVQELSPIGSGDRELEARQKDTDDHLTEHMFA
jgi:hypothetical protein